MIMDASLEIRKLPTSVIRELVETLEYAESWKRLMAIIPKSLNRDNYECKITLHNLPKYKSEHFKIIETVSYKTHRNCTEILLDEWGTSGRIRPTIGHLLYLLTRAELFRAADYIAINLLNQQPPERPKDGPAALITTELPPKPQKNEEIEQHLEQMTYSSSLLENINSNSFDTNINYSNNNATSYKTNKLVIPKIVISETPDAKSSSFSVSLIVPRNRQTDVSDSNNENVVSEEPQVPHLSFLMQNGESENSVLASSVSDTNTNSQTEDEVATSVSDMIKFSTGENAEVLQNLSVLNVEDIHEDNAPCLPAFSEIFHDNGDENIPVLLDDSAQNDDACYIPALSALHATTSDETSNFEDTRLDSTLKYYTTQNSNKTSNSPTLHLVSRNSTSRTTCVSPLPNLSLNTILKHFSYSELEAATDNFDETPHKNPLEMEGSKEESGGRFLGSGAFGSVFLALGLLPRPIAVKKLHLENVDVVNVDDTVTKQFRNEVELLCKYTHENLLSLVGFSCDGPTYCLMYEYISGGALKERLQNKKHKLPWTDRLQIALGTAKAVTYLHTFSTPLIHRDIKSANILLDCSNKPKLCDFGLIKLKPNQNTTTSTAVYGTSAYMAPEAFRGDVSVKMDTFSFGVVLLELLTALPPLDNDRKGCDLVTYMQENCEDGDIGRFSDTNAGSWMANGIKYDIALYEIANKCLEEKKRRPEMVSVETLLSNLVRDIT